MKKTLVLLLSSALLLSACGPASSIKEEVDTKPKETAPKSETVKKSLKDLLSLGSAQKCTYRFTTEDSNAQGELLINGKKFRQTTKIVSGNGSMTVSAYSDGEYMYTWNDELPNSGMKIKMDTNVSAAETGRAAGGSVMNLEEKYDYDCQPVTVSDADFALPANVQFTDLGDLSKLQGGVKNIDVDKLKQQFGDNQ